ncbi:MAG TPA: GNAT family N-acetyltransferase [Nocardioides sp.]|nr:GNAT family N-acetyltransferase [Nocardioides sp.]
MPTRYDVWFTDDARSFLDRAGEHLAADPVTGTVVATNAQRLAADAARGEEPRTPYSWFAVVSGPDGDVVGVAMRCAPFPPYPPYLLAMPDEAAAALADALLDRGEEVGGANGLRPAADVLAARIADRTGRATSVVMHTRLFELGTLVEPRPVPGRLRPVLEEEAELALRWIHRFFLDADEQAGREPGSGHSPEDFTIDDVHRRIAEDALWFWVDAGDRPVHLTGANPPAFGVTRVGPVFTPVEERGRGWASAAVAAVSRAYLRQGVRVTLFTDQANPTSNALYTALGYRPVVDTVDVRLH